MFCNKKLIVSFIFFAFIFSIFTSQLAKADNAFVFNHDLKRGTTNQDVKELQKFLNNNGFTVARSGMGSSGQETTFFGSATKNALVKFQKSNKITPAAGYFGLITRNVINKSASSLTTVSSQPEKKTSQTTKNDFYTIGGNVTGIVNSIVLQNNGKDDLVVDVSQSSNFTFSTAVADGASYNVAIKPKYLGQNCYVNNNNGVVKGADVKNIEVACGINLTYNPFTTILGGGTSVRTYTLAYIAGTGGTISGSASQTVNSGRNGSTVTAIPNTGYHFLNWSDSVATASRVETSVTTNKTVTANFEIDPVAPSNLSYNSPNVFVINTAISTLSPTVTGVVDDYSVTPGLPTGISLNTSTGQITGTPTVSTTQTTYTITAINELGSATTSVVIMVNGTITINSQVWMDRNVGATRMASSITDYLAYGDLFQWGRPVDGHQLISWTSATSGAATNDVEWVQTNTTTPGTNSFYISGLDWASVDGDGLIRQTIWGTGGTNSPCPVGWHVPSASEWAGVLSTGSITDFASAYSALKLTALGYRSDGNGTLLQTGISGVYWTNTPISNAARYLIFSNSAAHEGATYRLGGYGLRCIKDTSTISVTAIGAITGTTTVGSILTAGATSPSNATVVYQWQSATSTTGTYTNISGATSNTYTIAAGDFGNYIKVVATATGSYSGTVTSDATTAILNTYTYNGSSFAYGAVTSVNGRIWLDRNLGATRIAVASTDTAAYGDLFQWGRPDDGHQAITWTSITSGTPVNGTQSGAVANVIPATNTFILASSDWSSIDSDGVARHTNLSVNGTSNPCPSGFRIPTDAELSTEMAGWSSQNTSGAFGSSLKLTVAGFRKGSDGSLDRAGSYGYYWSNSENGTNANYAVFSSSTTSLNPNTRAYGFSVRCIKDTYTVTFDTNGGDGGSTANQELIPNTTTTLTLNGFTKTGYHFAGWATTTDGAVGYADGAGIKSGDITLYAKWTAVAIGDSYQGGLVAYILQSGDAGYATDTPHGLIAATTQSTSSVAWSKTAYTETSVPSSTLTALGSGSANTDHIIAQNGAGVDYAAGLARAYTGGGYNDWFLPSKDELHKLYLSRALIGGAGDNLLWSSSESSNSAAWDHVFDNTYGSQFSDPKSVNSLIRPVRTF